MFTLSDMMFVNADTLASLQIIQAENHPNKQVQGRNQSASGAKESLSVYGLFHFLCHTSQGKQKLRYMFLRPSLDLSVIRERLNTISVLLRPDNCTILQTIERSLKKVKDMRAVVIHLQKGVCDMPAKSSNIHKGVWGSMQIFIFQLLTILEAVRQLSEGQAPAIVSKVCLSHFMTTKANVPPSSSITYTRFISNRLAR